MFDINDNTKNWSLMKANNINELQNKCQWHNACCAVSIKNQKAQQTDIRDGVLMTLVLFEINRSDR
jgi:hypothetical protein